MPPRHPRHLSFSFFLFFPSPGFSFPFCRSYFSWALFCLFILSFFVCSLYRLRFSFRLPALLDDRLCCFVSVLHPLARCFRAGKYAYSPCVRSCYREKLYVFNVPLPGPVRTWFPSPLPDIGFLCLSDIWVLRDAHNRRKKWKWWSAWQGHIKHVCKISASTSRKRRGHLDFCAVNVPKSQLRIVITWLWFQPRPDLRRSMRLNIGLTQSVLGILPLNLAPTYLGALGNGALRK